MKKLAILLALVILVSIPVKAFAVARVAAVNPKLTFSGTTATCDVAVVGSNTSEFIEVTMKLMYGTSTVASWSAEGYGYVFLNKTAAVVVGRTYKLQVEVTIDGIEKDPVYVTGTC